MSSLIEQAARRLEQLREAGITVPEPAETAMPAAAPAAPSREAAVRYEPRPERQTYATPPGVTSRTVTLDLEGLAERGIATPAAARSHIADQFRVLKRPLIDNVTGKNAAGAIRHANLIMVTSALSGEGKSFTSINLAMSIAAELDHTVMLVDADVARPSVLKTLGLEPSPGLLEILEGRADVASTLLRTNVDKLTILPSGTPHPKATELLASEAMGALLDDFSTRYPDRILIFDSPPLLLTTESRVLASHMGQIVVVVNAGKTLQADVQHALSTIESCPVKMMVLNKARHVGTGGYAYGYGYGYGYGYSYGAHGADAPDGPKTKG